MVSIWVTPGWEAETSAGGCASAPMGRPERDDVRAYYNEIDPAAAAWLRELIKFGVDW